MRSCVWPRRQPWCATTTIAYTPIAGTVNFTGQPTDNPVVVATAAYDSPDGTKGFADFVGPVKTGKLTLRSEPPHTTTRPLPR